MAVIDQIFSHVSHVVARAVEADAAATTTSAPAETTTPASTGDNKGNNGSSSPLLFFVALGFGVVFTNLW